MTAILLIGIPASGKSTFCRQRLYDSHVRLSLDMLKTRHKQRILFEACLAAKTPFVIDDTNATEETRRRFIVPAKAAGFRVIGYYFSSVLAEALLRNDLRAGKARVPDQAVRGISGRMVLPAYAEGFDELWYVIIDGEGGFRIEQWQEEVQEDA